MEELCFPRLLLIRCGIPSSEKSQKLVFSGWPQSASFHLYGDLPYTTFPCAATQIFILFLFLSKNCIYSRGTLWWFDQHGDIIIIVKLTGYHFCCDEHVTSPLAGVQYSTQYYYYNHHTRLFILHNCDVVPLTNSPPPRDLHSILRFHVFNLF